MSLKRPFLINVLLFGLMFLTLPSLAQDATKSPPPSSKSTQVRNVRAFNHIFALGKLNLQLHTGYKKPQVILKGDPRDLAAVEITMKADILKISLGSGYPRYGAVTADIHGQILHSFTYRGEGSITGPKLHSGLLSLNITNPERTVLGGTIYLHNLTVNGPGYVEVSGVKSPSLNVKLKGNPKVQLIGLANLSDLQIDGGGSLTLYWVKSDNLVLRLKGRAFVQLAGITNRLDVELWNQARFMGRYLRADSIFAKTHDHSLAEISSLRKQHTLATDASDIFFYDIPDLKTDFMAFNGAVLDMRDLNWPYLEEYDNYNK